MKKITSLLILLLLCCCFSCNNDSSDDDDFMGTLQIIITNASAAPTGSLLVGIYDYPNIDETSRDPISSLIQPITSSQDSYTLTIEHIPAKTIYFAVLLDTNNLQPDTGERYFLYNYKIYGDTADGLTLSKDEPTVVTVDFTTFFTY